MAEQLQGKIAIVTFASNGIGRGIAELFAAEGAKTVLVARLRATARTHPRHERPHNGRAASSCANNWTCEGFCRSPRPLQC